MKDWPTQVTGILYLCRIGHTISSRFLSAVRRGPGGAFMPFVFIVILDRGWEGGRLIIGESGLDINVWLERL
jgi:hypothetical protein